jgi:NAD(P)-dependent dehydrogenase (short-subunit alcohol dehydrogenase family)
MGLSDNPVWFITGCSGGFGRELAKLVLSRGWRAVVTARDVARVQDLTSGYEDCALALPLDVTDNGQIAAAVEQAQERFGVIDVLVNNAGYGYQSSIEEGIDAEIRAQFETNVFGLAAMTRAVMPPPNTRWRDCPTPCLGRSLRWASRSRAWSRDRSAQIGQAAPSNKPCPLSTITRVRWGLVSSGRQPVAASNAATRFGQRKLSSRLSRRTSRRGTWFSEASRWRASARS